MKKEFIIENLHCANCATNLAAAVRQINGIVDADINFVTQKFSFEIKDDANYDEVFNKIKDLVSSFSAKVVLSEKKEVETNKNEASFDYKKLISFITFVLGVAVGIVSIVLKVDVWLEYTLVIASALLIGYKIYYKALKLILKGVVDENLLLTISVFGAIAIGESTEGLMVVLLYSIGKMLEVVAINKSRTNIKDLMELSPEMANVKEGSVVVSKKVEDITIGSLLVVKAGERIPLDGIIRNGNASVDIKHITGESVPMFAKTDDEVYAGSVVLDGVLEIEATTNYQTSTVAKIMNLIEQASNKKSKTETFVSKFAKTYTILVMVSAVITGVVVSLVTKNINEGIYRGLSFLVVACPCAFAISVPLSYFSGIGNASKNGILIKGSSYIDVASKLKVIAFDKTGTMTTGNFEVIEVESLNSNFSMIDVLKFACYGEQYSSHLIAKAILKYGEDIKLRDVQDFKEIAGKGVSYTLGGQTIFVGREEQESDSVNKTSVVVLADNEPIGRIILADSIKDGAEETVKWFNDKKIKTIMLSGDNEVITKVVAEEIGIKEFHYKLTPEEKYEHLEGLIQNPNSGAVAYVGDGINDAPSLALADIGISMGINGSASSIEASDVVIADDKPKQIVNLVKISNNTTKIVKENIIFAMIIKLLFLVLSALGITSMVFAVFADVGVTLIAIINSMRALFYKPNKKRKNKA